jgi:type IV pilus assembly protein PilW
MNCTHAIAKKQRGLSLVELMIALTIGLLLLTGLSLIFVNSSQANRELQKTSQQIENGRYAIDIISQDLRLAGFYGHFHDLPAAPAGLPDPCEIASAALLLDALALPVQGYRAADLTTRADISASTCDEKNLLTNANLKPGSDVLVIRRADTNVLSRPAGVAPTNEFYLQTTGTSAEVQIGGGIAIGVSNKADGVTASTFFLKDTTTPAPIRKLHVHVYFIAPCSVGSGSATVNGVAITGICTGTAPEDTIPTLKRLEMVASQGAVNNLFPAGSTTMRLVPLVEGVEYLKIEYGVDSSPGGTPDTNTGLTGDATVDGAYVGTAASLDDWTKVIAAKIYVLARNTEPTADFTDNKTYTLGSVATPPEVGPVGDRFRRHVYTAAVRLMNPSGRRERP